MYFKIFVYVFRNFYTYTETAFFHGTFSLAINLFLGGLAGKSSKSSKA